MILELKNLNIGYSNLHVVRDVSLRIDKGEIVALLGLNGAGKTTTLKTIAGLLNPISGSVIFNGKDITRTAAHEIVKRGLAFIPEERALYEGMNVYENLLMGAYTIKKNGEVKETLDYVYELFPRLAERKKQYVGTMSGGERQMVAIARGLMSKPKLIMLDEPSMGLSPQNVQVVFDTIKRLQKEAVTVIIVEQNVFNTMEVANRAYVMEQGEIRLEGSSKDLMNNDHIKKMYLGISD